MFFVLLHNFLLEFVLMSFCNIYPRLRSLLHEIGSEKENKTIIFVETKKRVDDITRTIRRDG